MKFTVGHLITTFQPRKGEPVFPLLLIQQLYLKTQLPWSLCHWEFLWRSSFFLVWQTAILWAIALWEHCVQEISVMATNPMRSFFCSDEHGECRFILEYIMFASCIHDSCVFYVHRMCGTAFHELQLVAVRFLDAEGN